MSSNIIPNIIDEQVIIALRSFILFLLPEIEVIQGQDNNVPMPIGGFILVNNFDKKRLSTIINKYTDPGGTTGGTQNMITPTNYTLQVDCYGPESGDWATVIHSVFNASYAFDRFPDNIKPLYTDDPMQLPLIDGEQQYHQRWKLKVSIQYNPIVSAPMQFFDKDQPVGMVPIF